jgi:hypothetical protein
VPKILGTIIVGRYPLLLMHLLYLLVSYTQRREIKDYVISEELVLVAARSEA